MSSCDFEVVHVGKDTLRVTPMQGGPTRLFDFGTLSALLESQRIQIEYVPPSASDPIENGVRSGLTEGQLEALKRKLHYVHGVYRGTEAPCSQKLIREQIPALAKSLHDQDPPGASTVASWVKLWLDGDRKDAALMPRPKPSRFESDLDPEVQQMMMESIQAVYMTRQRNSMKAVGADLELRIAQHNRNSENPLSPPSNETIRRYIQRIDLFKRNKARHGAAFANRRHRAAGQAFQATEILEIAMADGQVIDLILVDHEGNDIGRAFLTVIIDVYSRCVLAAFISLAPFSGATLLKAIGHAVLGRGHEPAGVPTKLIVDNGSDYRHAGFLRFCSRLNILVEPCPPRTPNAKAIVERFFKTLNQGLMHKLPGTTFSNPSDRGEYDSQKYARLTIDEVRKHVENWIHEVYHVTFHRGIGRAPIDVWNEGVEV